MKFGHHFYNWDWDWRPDVDRLLRLTRETGYEGFELKPSRLNVEADELREKCTGAGLTCAAIGGFGHIKDVIDYAHAAGAPNVRCGVPKGEAQRWVDYAGERGVTIVIHNHTGRDGPGSGEVETREDLLRCLDECPGLMACPDTGHLYICGSDPVQTIRDLGDRCGYVHLKDYDPALVAQGLKGPSFVELGTGAFDLPGAMQALEDIGYTGWVMVERDRRVDDYVQSAHNMRRVLSELGY